MSFRIVIPARHAAVRLPGKPLADVGGRPLIEHVFRRACETGAGQVVIATDDERIAEAARGFGAEVCLTGTHHRNGTERIGEVVRLLGWPEEAVVVNLQGDEPLMPPGCLREVAALLAADPHAAVATLATPVATADELFDPHVVKVVRDAAGRALYFSRAPVPWHRDAFAGGARALPRGAAECLRHIGLYAYRAGFLARYAELAPSPLEEAEALEQLRVLWHGHDIAVGLAEEVPPPGVDTEADLERVRALLHAEDRGQKPEDGAV